MKDAECAETNEKSIFQFFIFEICHFCTQNCQFSLNFLFVPAHFASFMQIWYVCTCLLGPVLVYILAMGGQYFNLILIFKKYILFLITA